MNKTTGSALIVTLLIVAMIVTITTLLATKTLYETKKTIRWFRLNQSRLYSQYLVAWSKSVIHDTAKDNTLNDIHYHANKAGYTLDATLLDAQSKFNINNLNDERSLAIFKELLFIALPDKNKKRLTTRASIIENWIKQQGLVADLKEITAIEGVSSKIYNALKTYCTALPSVTKINIKTASKPLLEIVDNNASTNTSNYFFLQSTISIEEQHLYQCSLLKRKGSSSYEQLWTKRGDCS